MNKFIAVLAAILAIGSTSIARADDLATDLSADAIRSHGPLVGRQLLTTRPVALPRRAADSNSAWMERASQSFDGGFY